MITFETQKINNSLNNIRIPHPRLQNRVSLSQKADTFTPSFCANADATTKIGALMQRLFTPKNPEVLQELEALNYTMPLPYKL